MSEKTYTPQAGDVVAINGNERMVITSNESTTITAHDPGLADKTIFAIFDDATRGSLQFIRPMTAAERARFGLAPEPDRIARVLGLDQPYPLTSVLEILASASQRLLDRYDYDGADYEEIQACVVRAVEIARDILKHF